MKRSLYNIFALTMEKMVIFWYNEKFIYVNSKNTLNKLWHNDFPEFLKLTSDLLNI